MEQVKNLDDKRVCDKSKDGKVIVIRKKDCITRITANADRTLKVIWTRVSEDTEADRVWNEQHFGGAKSVVITGADVKVRATFYCDLIDTTTRQSLL